MEIKKEGWCKLKCRDVIASGCARHKFDKYSQAFRLRGTSPARLLSRRLEVFNHFSRQGNNVGRRSIKGIFRPVRDEISAVDSPKGYFIPDGKDFIFFSFLPS